MLLTILICTHNRSWLLNRTIVSLNKAPRPPGWQIDIMVVANACTDNTENLLAEYQAQTARDDRLPLIWHTEATPGKSYALNSAIPRLSSQFVAFVDDDHRVDNNFLKYISKAVDSNPDATMFCGRILPDWDGSEPEWVHDTGPYRIYPLPVPRQDQGASSHPITQDGTIPGGGNLILRKEVLDRIGRFSTRLGPQGHNLGGGEDTDFVLRALNAGEQLIYIPSIVQFHYVDPIRLQLGYLLRKSYQRSRASAKAGKRHKQVPLYMWRKLVEYIFNGIFSLQWKKTRFYLVRTAAALGEMRGMRELT